MIKGKVIIFSNEKLVGLYFRNLIEDLGYEILSIAFNLKDFIEALKLSTPDFVLINISNDFKEREKLEALLRKFDLPIVFINSDPHFINTLATNNVLSYVSKGPSKEELNNTIMAAIKTGEIYKNLKRSYEQLQERLLEIINVIALIVEKRDLYTAGHQQRVANLSKAISKKLGMSEEESRNIYTAGLLHDVGKIVIPAEILAKPARLSKVEMELMKTHSVVGYEILKNISFEYPIAEIVLQHHERLDGSGYPYGLKGKEILFESQIIAVADVVEAISNHRPYRPALGIDYALKEIRSKRGVLFIPEVVDACIELFEKKQFSFDSTQIH